MPARWTCEEHPASHGSFTQASLDNLAEIDKHTGNPGFLQPVNRYACPRCYADGFSGWMYPTCCRHEQVAA